MAFPLVEFLTILGAFGIGAISPGPDFAMVLRQSIAHGRSTAIVTSAGIASAILVHGTYTILGLGLIVAQSLIMFTILKFAGAAYLIWLGIAALRAPAPKEATNFNEANGAGQTWLKAFSIGFLTNLLNPKAVLFFVALFSVLVSADTAIIWQGVYIISMALMLLIWFVLVSLFFTEPRIRAGFYRMGKWFNRVTGVALILLALRLLVAQKE
ncbi:MAG: LysE family transporter [Devosiaceae bacterium]|nr:LysE family transporter [Devosiaceae bacterium]